MKFFYCFKILFNKQGSKTIVQINQTEETALEYQLYTCYGLPMAAFLYHLNFVGQPQCHVFLNCPPCYQEHKMIAFKIYNTRVIHSGFAEIAPINNIYWLYVTDF